MSRELVEGAFEAQVRVVRRSGASQSHSRTCLGKAIFRNS
jgi:hypothetical protein